MRIRATAQRTTALLMLGLASSPAGSLLAQPPAAAGVRIRMQVAPPPGVRGVPGLNAGTAIVGRLVTWRHDTLVVSLGAGRAPVAVPAGWLTSLEVSRGRQSNARNGALTGLVAGTVIGVATALVLCRDAACESSGGDFRGAAVLVLGGAGLVVGTAIGAVLGTIFRTERWEYRGFRDDHPRASRAGGAVVRYAVALPLSKARPG